MTTLDELVLTEPVAAHGCPTEIPADAGVWRIVVELADPSAGASVEWHDITDYVAGWQNVRGADQYAGRYRASVVDLDLFAPDDALAPWNTDTSPTFGVHVPLGPGLIMRAGFIRVDGGVVAEWNPRWTNRVERWGDACYSRGRIRRHSIVARDLLTALVNVPIAASSDENWLDRVAYILTEAGWPFGSQGFGATFLPGAISVLDIPDRPAQSSALDELAATCDPAGVTYFTDRRGALMIRPQVFDTFHADAFEAGADGTEWDEPATVTFDYLAEQDDGLLGYAAYAIDSPGVDPFGFDEAEDGVINHVVVVGPGGTFDDDDPISIQRYDRKTMQASWVVDNDQAAGDILNYRANAIVEARPLYTTLDNHGFFPGPAGLDFLDPVSILHQTAPGRPIAFGNGWVRQYTERCAPRGRTGQDTTWDLSIIVDIWSIDSDDALLPVEDLTVVDAGETSAEFSWTNPTQVVTPTHTQYRLLNSASLWATDTYPITGIEWGGLDPATSYEFQVRLLRIVDGVITHVSPSRQVTFTTDPATVPVIDIDDDGDGTVTFPDPDPCEEIDWELQVSDDGETWSVLDDGTLVAPPWTVPLDGYTFDPTKLYRVWQDACGDESYSNLFAGACSEPAALSDPPFDDADLVAYWPAVCPPDSIREALSESPANNGPCFDLFVIDDGNIVLVANGDGTVAYGFTPGTTVPGDSDMTLAAKVMVMTQPDAPVTIFGFEGLAIQIVAEGSYWTIRGTAQEVGAGLTTITSGDELDFGTWYDLAVVHDVAAGSLIAYVNGGVAVSTMSGVGARTTPGTFAIGQSDNGLVTNCAVWDRVLEAAELPGYVAPLTVTVNKKVGQLDPTSARPILYTAVFSEAVTGFTNADVTLAGSGAAGSPSPTVSVSTADNITWEISVTPTAFNATGPVTVTIGAGVCTASGSGVSNEASTSTDNSVDFNVLGGAIVALSPAGYWRLDDSSTTATDASGNSRHGSFSGTYTLQNTLGPDGVTYASFNAGYVEIADNNAWSANTASGLTVMAMIKPSGSLTVIRDVAAKGTTSNFEWRLAGGNNYLSNQLLAGIWKPDGSGYMATEIVGSILDTTWQLVAFRVPSPTTGVRFDLMRNSNTPLSSSTAEAAASGTYTNGTCPVRIGWRTGNVANQYFQGVIAHVAIFPGQVNLSTVFAAAVTEGWI